MLSRRCASTACESRCKPASSGPRCVMMSRIATPRAVAPSSSLYGEANPAIPHITRLRGHSGLGGPLAAGTLPEPELQHHQPPEAMAMVACAVAVLAPQRRDGAVIEHAAIAQLPIEQEGVHHRR